MTDYFYGDTEEEALEKANEYAASNGTVEFTGDENCNDFNGDCCWDGESRRCACGNRRVEWTTDKTEFGWLCFAEAW